MGNSLAILTFVYLSMHSFERCSHDGEAQQTHDLCFQLLFNSLLLVFCSFLPVVCKTFKIIIVH